MKILLVSLNYAPEPTGIGLYSGDFARALVASGHEVSVICAKPHYPQWKIYDGHDSIGWDTYREDGVEVLRCPIYVPAEPGGFKRILNYLSFAASSFFPILFKGADSKADLIINVAPSLLGAPAVLLAGALGNAKTMLHVQDFEVEAAFATGHLDGKGSFARAALWLEQQLIRRFLLATSISPEMCKKLVEKGAAEERVFELRNWAALDHVTPQAHSVFRDQWQLHDKQVVLYSGSLSSKQGIEILVELADIMRDRPELHFVICGQGPSREMLDRAAATRSNMSVYDLQPMEQLGELMALADVHILPQKADAADLVLPSKLTNMLASGRPVVAGAHAGTGLAREVEGCGISVEPENASAMADAIRLLLDDKKLHDGYCGEARKRALERWSKAAIIAGFEERAATLVAQAIVPTKPLASAG